MNELWLAQAFGGEGPSPFGPMGVMLLIFGFFYFLVIRPQQRREKDKEAMRASVKKNDEVVTSGGLHGRVVDVKANILFVEIAPNVRVRMERASVEAVPSRVGRSEEQGTAKE
jgi:preprotein translocase subunit YajC